MFGVGEDDEASDNEAEGTDHCVDVISVEEVSHPTSI